MIGRSTPRGRAILPFFAALLVGLPLGACRDEPGGVGQTPTYDDGHPKTQVEDPKLEDAFEAYEDIRLKLAAGKTDALSNLALQLASRSRQAAAEHQGEAREPLEKLADAANRYAKDEGDLEAKREAFGELSDLLVAVMRADPQSREGRMVYRCEEVGAEWVQSGGEMQNPYLGGDGCGEHVPWPD